MTHPICRVRDFEIAAQYTLRVVFDDATEQVIDFERVLRGELYGPLRDQSLFSRVAVDSVAHTLVWPNGADFDPATLHDWPHCKAAFIEMASIGISCAPDWDQTSEAQRFSREWKPPDDLLSAECGKPPKKRCRTKDGCRIRNYRDPPKSQFSDASFGLLQPAL